MVMNLFCIGKRKIVEKPRTIEKRAGEDMNPL
jgi:hypothetical protein